MNIHEALAAGRLDLAMTAAQDAARKAPAESRHRILLFQLLCLDGAWERALRQLAVLSGLDDALETMAGAYRQLIACETVRQAVFAKAVAPHCLGEPPAWFGPLAEALRLDAEGHHAAAQAMRLAAFDQAEPSAGAMNGEAFAWIADADERLGPVLEVMVNGRYFWVPFIRIAAIAIEPPADLRDLVWLPASFTWTNGGAAMGFIPTRYPGSESAPEDALRLARRTDWKQAGEGASWTGIGQRVLATDAGETALLDLRDLALDPAAPGTG